MAAGLSDTAHDIQWIVSLIDARAPKPGPRGPYKKAASSKDKVRCCQLLPKIAIPGNITSLRPFIRWTSEEMPNDRSRI